MNALLLDAAVALTPLLLAAVLVALGVMGAWVALLAGGFARECVQRRAQRAALDEALRLAAPRAGRRTPRATPLEADVLLALGASPPGLATRAAEELAARGPDDADLILQALDARVERVLASHTLLTRLAPMGGLVATLLPLGPALSRLTEGDLPALAEDLTVAFTATVAGLVVSCAAFGMGTLRRRWYDDDLQRLELVLLRLLPDDAVSSERSARPTNGDGVGSLDEEPEQPSPARAATDVGTRTAPDAGPAREHAGSAPSTERAPC